MRIPVKQIIQTYKEIGSVGKTASLLGVSRPTIYRWLIRGRTTRNKLRYRGVFRHSTRPKTVYYKLSIPLREQIVSLKETEHFGARKIARVLGLSVSAMTVHRFLGRKNLVVKQTNFRRPLFQNGFAMRPANTTTLGYLQMDTKHVTPELGGLTTTVYEYAAIDILSRYKLAVLLPDISDECASLALEYFLKWFPFKIVYIQTDNGLEHQGTFDKSCQKHQISHYFIHKNSPNENAVIERSFKTDQEEFYFWLEKAPEHIGELNDWLQKFIAKYNTWRPHQALHYQTPAEFVKLYQESVTKVVLP